MGYLLNSRISRGCEAALTLLLVLALGFGTVAARQGTAEAGSLLADLGYAELTVATDGTALTVPAEIEAGRYRVVFENSSDLGAELNVYTIPTGTTIDEVRTAIEAFETADTPPDLFFSLVFHGGIVAAPGATDDVVLDLTAGEMIFDATISDEETGETTDLLIESVSVTGDPTAVEDPAVAAEASMSDFEFALNPASIPSGPGIWKLTNAGTEPHHMVLFQVPDNTTEDQLHDLIGSFFGPPPAPDATPVESALSFEDIVEVFGSSIVSPGQSNWVDLDLTPGTYGAVCFLPTADGAPHVMLGMIQIFTVA